MRFIMWQNQFLVGTIAFAVSFGLSLFAGQDPARSMLIGLIAVPSALTASLFTEQRSDKEAKKRLAALKSQIRALKQQRTDIYESLTELDAERQQAEDDLYGLQIQISQHQTYYNQYYAPQAQYQLPPSQPAANQLPPSQPRSHQALSWDLSAQRALPPQVEPKALLPQVRQEMPPALDLPQSPYARNPERDRQETELNQFLASTAATKQTIEASLEALQEEQNQLQKQVAANQTIKDQLTQEISALKDQKYQLTIKTDNLRTQIQNFEQAKVDLSQSLSALSAKKQEAEAGSAPLQTSVKQLQAQIVALRTELSQIETKILDHCAQKDALEQELTALKGQKQQLEGSGTRLQAQASSMRGEIRQLETQVSDRQKQKAALEQEINTLKVKKSQGATGVQAAQGTVPRPDSSPNGQAPTPSGKATPASPVATQPPAQTSPVSPVTTVSTTPQPKANAKTSSATVRPEVTVEVLVPKVTPAPTLTTINVEKPDVEKSSQELSSEWTEFMVQLPDYELLALKAIAEQSQPAATLKKIAEDNLTMPELLVDSINERALETVGDIIIEPGSSSTIVAIVREHAKTVKKLLKTYEYLME